MCCINNRHITATHFFVEPVDSAAREFLVIDRLTNEIILTSMNTKSLITVKNEGFLVILFSHQMYSMLRTGLSVVAVL